MFSRYLLLGASLLLTPSAAPTPSGCQDPTPGQRNWWHRPPGATPGSADFVATPLAPTIALPAQTALLAGRYRLQLVQTLGSEARETGVLVLQEPDSLDLEEKRLLRGYFEGSDASEIFRRAAGTPAFRSATQPSVEAYYSESGHLELWIGTPGINSNLAGVGFSVFELSDGTFRGRWIDGGTATVIEDGVVLGPPQGYFCAERLPE